MLGGRYALGPTLGVGGMAEVWAATDTRLGRQVAVKVLRADLARDPAFHERFRREAQAAASIDAPSIVSVYDTGEDVLDGQRVPWIVMELVDGRTLRDVLATEGRLLPQRAYEVVADVCAALQVAHDAGIVHRDVKPGNVMLSRSGDVKVMDFGIARAASGGSQTVTETAAVIGTAAYLSPEQARGEHVDARSDVYSTGCLLYELVTGSPPFTGDSPVAVAYQHVREDPVPPTAWDASLSPEVDAVVLKAMAKNPGNRYASAADMRADLLRLADGAPVLATPVLEPGTVVPDPGRLPDRERRTRYLAYALFAALLVAIVVGLGLLVQSVLDEESGLVATPALVGETQEQAQVLLAEVGLTLGAREERFDPAPVGTVLEQSPVGGILVREGGTVDVVLSLGPELTVVPQVVGQSQEEAEAQLAAAKLTVSEVIPRGGNIEPGQVLDVLPGPGTQLQAGGTVQLVVSSGQVEVPFVVGKPQAQAEEELQRAGFNVGVQPQPDTGPPGVVLAQDPVNAIGRRGDTVVITVSAPPPPPTPTPAPTTAPPSAPPSATPTPPAPTATPTA